MGIAPSGVEVTAASPRDRGLRPPARLSLFYAAAFLVSGTQLPFWPVWLAARGFGAEQIGTLFAVAIWTRVITTPVIGLLADRFGRRRVMVVLATTAVCGYGALAPAAGLWPILLLNVVATTAQSPLLPLGDAITLAAARAGRLDYGRIRVWGSLSFIVASLGAGTILTQRPPDAILALVFGASLLLLAACLTVPRLEPAAGTGAATRRGLGAGWRAAFRIPRFWVFIASAAILQASHQLYYGFGTLYWRSLGYSPTTIGWLWAEGVAAEVVLFWQGRGLLARFGPVGLMAIGGVAGILRWGLAGFVVALPATMMLQLLHALTFAASYLGSLHYLVRVVPPAAAASAQTLYSAISSALGGGLVMVAAGALYANFGGRAYLAMAVLSAAGLAGGLALRSVQPPRG